MTTPAPDAQYGPDSYEALLQEIREATHGRVRTEEVARRADLSPETVRWMLGGRRRLRPEVAYILGEIFPEVGASWGPRAQWLYGAAGQGRTAGGQPRNVSSSRTGERPLIVNGDHNIVNFTPTWAPLPPDPTSATTIEQFIELLRLLRIWAGNPSLRDLEEAGRGDLPRSTVSDMLKHTYRLPKRHLLRTFVFACGAGSEWPRWDFAWQNLSAVRR